ncbi:hypothetical protein E4T42_08095 [Aureobasidium subglaciale]|nr:hypothetical protein E4T42_08095 [Aureobasidium subglaciale]
MSIRLAKSTPMAHDLRGRNCAVCQAFSVLRHTCRTSSCAYGYSFLRLRHRLYHLNPCKTSECLEDNRLYAHWRIWTSIIAAMHIRLASAATNN